MNIKKDEQHPMLVEHMERTLENAKSILFRMDSEVDKLEGEGVYESFIAIQDLVMEWNLLGHNFASWLVYDWVEKPSE